MINFIKTNKILIFSILAASIISSSLTAFAGIMYHANEIEYTSKNANFKASTVSEALDTLHYSATTKNYSTEEQVVGTWIDGKPIYRKVIDIGTTIKVGYLNRWTNIYNVSDLNIEKAITIDLYNEYMTSITYCFTHDYDRSSGFIKAYGETTNFNDVRYIVLEYTKTTDKAQ